MSIYKGTEFIAGTPDLSDYAKSSDLLNAIYPIGSTYISTTNSCPLSTLISGSTWTQIASNVVVSVNTSVPVKGNGKSIGLTTNGSNIYGLMGGQSNGDSVMTCTNNGTLPISGNVSNIGYTNNVLGVTTDSSKSGIVGTVTRTNLALYIFKRTA